MIKLWLGLKMDNKTAKNYVESLIFSALEPLSKNDIRKMLSEYGDFDLDKILNELTSDYKSRGIVLSKIENRFFLKLQVVLKII